VTATLDSPSGDLVSVSVSVSGPAARVSAIGEIDCSSAPQLTAELDRALDAGIRELTVDLAGVTFLDSAGLCTLAAAHRRAVAEGVALRVLAASRAVIRPLQITGLWELLAVEQV
jgi:anti-sigma B factor antagonist